MLFTLSSIVLALIYHLCFHQRFHLDGKSLIASSLMLFFSVGLIYFSDRLIDSLQSQVTPQRKQFASRHPWFFGMVSFSFLIGMIGVVGFLPYSLIERGLFLGGLVLIYGWTIVSKPHKFYGGFKEIIIALIFSLGVTIHQWNQSTLMVIITYFLLILYGLIAISKKDLEIDRSCGMPNIFIAWQWFKRRYLQLFILAWAIYLFTQDIVLCVVYLLSILGVEFCLIWFKGKAKDDLFHFSIDLALLFPFLILSLKAFL